MSDFRSGLLVVTLLFSVLLTTGCSRYVLRGRVVEGGGAGVMAVSPDDPRLAQPGVPNVEIRVFRNHRRPNPELAVSGVTDVDGSFSLPIEAFGAGWMEETWLIRARRAGYGDAEATISLPSEDGRVLILLGPGASTPWIDPNDPMQQYQDFR